MVRPSFIKSLDIDGDNKMTVKAWLVEIFWYNRPMIFFRRLGRFIQRLPKWLKLCWKTENWDYESIYDFIEMQLKEMKKAQEKDTWHAPHNVKRAIQQIKCTLAHLDRYKNWTDYYEWPESHMEKCEEKDPKYGKLYHIVYDDPKAKEKIKLVHKMEEKHYNKFWYMLKKYHKNWWT